MITYHSTRGDKQTYTFSEAILKGIAADGGLLLPFEIPQIPSDQLKTLKHKSYQEIALYIFSRFQTDLSNSLLQRIISQAYASNFDSGQITPVIHLKEKEYLLELWHGPTSAFKDLALQLMPLLFAEAALKNTPKLKYLILVATSGDTGKAALEGYKDKKRVSIMVLYPNKRVSQLQELQMKTQEGNNVSVIAMKGDFDTVQKSVKEVFNDKKFNQELSDQYNTILSSANSINWGRLMPQIVYQFYGYLQMVNKGAVSFGNPIDIAVPTGNFGNIQAAFYAKKMGLPVRKLICATNANNVLTDFVNTGKYDIEKRHLVQTSSPSMDILVASNIERLLYSITNDPEKVSGWMGELKAKKKFTVDEKTLKILQMEFYSDSITNEECRKQIKKVFDETGYVMDPHTAVAQGVTEKFGNELPVLISSTAHYAKFPSAVYEALMGEKAENTSVFVMLEKIKRLAPETYIPKNILELKDKKVLHYDICKAGKDEIESKIIKFLG